MSFFRPVDQQLPDGTSPVLHARGTSIATREGAVLCHVVVDGVFASVQSLPDRTEQIVGYYLPGDVCGLSAIARLHGEYAIRAVSSSVCVPIPARRLTELAASSTTWRDTLLRAICVEAAIARQWISNCGRRSAQQRLAHLACELEARLAAIGVCKNASFQGFGSQRDLSAATGLSVVHVNKTLRWLRVEGLVDWGKTVRILDPARVRSFAGFDPSYLGLDQPKLGHLLLPNSASWPPRKDFDGCRAPDRQIDLGRRRECTLAHGS